MPVKITNNEGELVSQVKYAKTTLSGTIATQTKSIDVTIVFRGNKEIEEILKNANSGELKFNLNVKPLIEKVCPVCNTKFYPELRGKRNQKYDKDACKSKAYRDRKK